MNYQIHQLYSNSSTIYLLEFDVLFNPHDYLDTLTAFEVEKFYSFKSNKRKCEYVATRILKHNLFGYQEIKYNEHGAPFIERDEYISISHAQNLVGIAINTSYQIGFDIERIDEKILKISDKFLNTREKNIFDLSNPEELIGSWSTKETLYKLAGRKLIDFKKDLLINQFSNNKVEALINNIDHKIHVEIELIKFKNYIITINSKKLNYEYESKITQ